MLLGKLVLLERCSDPREAVHAREARELNINKKYSWLQKKEKFQLRSLVTEG